MAACRLSNTCMADSCEFGSYLRHEMIVASRLHARNQCQCAVPHLQYALQQWRAALNLCATQHGEQQHRCVCQACPLSCVPASHDSLVSPLRQHSFRKPCHFCSAGGLLVAAQACWARLMRLS
jgi:hypothetical protein